MLQITSQLINPTKNLPNKEDLQKDVSEKDVTKEKNPQEDDVKKIPETKKHIFHVEKTQPSFNLENKISKIKMSLPFSEILRN